MGKGYLTLLFLLLTVLPACGAPVNTSGPWGVSVSGFSNFSAAASNPATAGKTMVITKTMDCNDLTIPADRAIEVKKGGKIRYSGNLVINGPFSAGLYPVLEKVGSGTLVFGGAGRKLPLEWFGAVGDGNVANATVNINALAEAGAALAVSTGVIQLSAGTYKFGGRVVTLDNVVLEGISRDVTVFDLYDDSVLNSSHGGIIGNSENLTLRNIHFKNDGYAITRHKAILYSNKNNTTIDQCKFTCGYKPFKLGDNAASGTNPYKFQITNNVFVNAATGGQPYISINNDSATAPADCLIAYNTMDPATDLTVENSAASIDLTVNRCRIVGNLVGGSWVGGINVEDGGSGPHIITDNIIDMRTNTKTGMVGILLSKTDSALVSKNTIYGRGDVADVNHIGIQVNPLSSKTDFTDPKANTVTISSNHVFGTYAGVYVSSTGGLGNLNITDNTVSVYGETVRAYATDATGAASQVVIKGNELRHESTTGTGMFIGGAVENVFTVDITGNTFLALVPGSYTAGFMRLINVPGQVGFNSAPQGIKPYDLIYFDANNSDAIKANVSWSHSRKITTFADADATPSVMNATICKTTGTTAITAFDDGVYGQEITIIAGANITITNGATIKLAGAANFAMTADDTLSLIRNNTIWTEVSRSVN